MGAWKLRLAQGLRLGERMSLDGLEKEVRATALLAQILLERTMTCPTCKELIEIVIHGVRPPTWQCPDCGKEIPEGVPIDLEGSDEDD